MSGEARERLRTLDVREELRAGREPLGRILETVRGLEEGEGLRLLATFEPLPLYRVLEARGFTHRARRLGEGDWEVLFLPAGTAGGEPARGRAAAGGAKADEEWPEPVRRLDNRGLEPPEPMMRILEALEGMEPGEVLEAINEREPVFLYPELEARGHAIRSERRADGVRLLVRRGPGAGGEAREAR
ncbi:MAG: DUF2249 domain-containing protein [Firmicutes bacterium]|nr:DUF2249 domain-containing protein [Bacillota bacterium]